MRNFNTMTFVHVIGIVCGAIGLICTLISKDWASAGWALGATIWCTSSFLWYKSSREK